MLPEWQCVALHSILWCYPIGHKNLTEESKDAFR
jgi:hypothetical protein